jgi:oligoribonuclease NrnB/cAMP/cGMP phosphodiesterase (DHH superfamily)
MSSNNSKPILVIYHADCLDGFGAAWSAFKAFGNQANYVAARFGEPFPKHTSDCEIYIVDFCYPPDVLKVASQTAAKITIIDHHITAIQQFENVTLPENVTLYFDINHSGCVLAWNYFFPEITPPQILKHIEDRDLWLFELDGSKEITTALYEQMPLSFKSFGTLKLSKLFAVGQIQVAQFSKMVQRLVKNAHAIKLGHIKGLAVNAPSFFASELGHALAEKSGTFGMTYHFDGRKKQWIFGLRSVGDFDVGQLAVEFGGGGHLNASGFSLPNNPFLSN